MKTEIIVTGACGRMGHMIAGMVEANDNYQLVGMVERSERLSDLSSATCPVSDDLRSIAVKFPNAVIIDFTAPEASMANAEIASQTGNAIVIGTTGLTDEQKLKLAELAQNTRIFWSPNMSIGINVLLKILPELTRALGEAYDIDMTEIHHNKKKDAPSGTALILGECLAKARGWNLPDVVNSHREGIIGPRPKNEIGIQAVRGGDVVGVHTIYFMGPGERIEVTHQAHSRENFAGGAIRAAAWLAKQKPGKLYAMSDVLE